MAWIESHESLPGHPKTKRLCRLLKISSVQAVGHLHYLWWWALKHAQDGDLSRYTALDIADACDWIGDEEEFVKALISSGFIDSTMEGNCIHDWYDYAGKLLELRMKDAERKRNIRGKKTQSPVDVQWTSDGHLTESDGCLTESIRNPNPNLNLNQNHYINNVLNEDCNASGNVTVTLGNATDIDIDKDINNKMVKLQEAYAALHGKFPEQIKPKEIMSMKALLEQIPLDFIISTMTAFYTDKKMQGDIITSFIYYENAIKREWKNTQKPKVNINARQEEVKPKRVYEEPVYEPKVVI
jgi:hypothetical protein